MKVELTPTGEINLLGLSASKARHIYISVARQEKAERITNSEHHRDNLKFLDLINIDYLKFLRRMALGYLVYMQLKDQEKIFTPTVAVPSLPDEFLKTEKFINEIENRLSKDAMHRVS